MAEVSALDDLEFFAIVARSASLTAVAMELGVSLSAVSKRLRRIEERLGTRLVQRSTRRLMLTDAGTRYADGARNLLRDRAALEDDVRADATRLRGRLAVHSTMGLGRAHIAPLAADFAREHPDLQLELTVSDRPFNIIGTGYDVSIRVGESPDSRLRMRILHPNERVVVAAPSYLAAHGAPTTVDDLADHTCLVLKENDADYALWRFGIGHEQRTVRVTGSLTSNDGDIVVEWCRAGLGLALRSTWHVAPLIASGELVQVLDGVPRPPADIHAVYAGDHTTSRVEAFLQALREGLRRRLAPGLR